MDALTVLYDETCAFCVSCARWLSTQEAFLRVECVPAGSEQTRRRYPNVRRAERQELVAIDDAGGVYRDADAWLMCLYALVEYRRWALRLASPALRPLARGIFKAVSSNRQWVSSVLWGLRDDELDERLRTVGVAPDAPACGTDGRCAPA